jgi:lactoylglutathione lyase
MLIGHIALYTDDLETMKNFYEKYFGAEANGLYENDNTGFQSYFLTFDDGGPLLEIMRRPHIAGRPGGENLGYAHIAISAGSAGTVDSLTKSLRADGYTVKIEPRFTGDGFYESVVLDPDENEIEITV